MVRHIVAREFLESLESSRFIISTVLCVCLIVLAVYVSTDDYVERLRDHDAAVATHEKRTEWTTIYRRPRVLGIFSEGVDKHVGNMVEISIWASPFRARGYGWQSRETEYMASFASIDVAFVIKFILSLLAIFLTYDAISGEREAGLLRLVLSNSISRFTFLIGKLLGRFLSLLIPLVIGILISLLFLLSNFFIAHQEPYRRMRETRKQINQEYERGLMRKQAIAEALARISPSAVFQMAAELVANSGSSFQKRLWKAAERYQKIYLDYVESKVSEIVSDWQHGGTVHLPDKTRVDIPEIRPKRHEGDMSDFPVFAYPHPSIQERLQDALSDIALLLLWNIACFLGAHIFFLRRDI